MLLDLWGLQLFEIVNPCGGLSLSSSQPGGAPVYGILWPYLFFMLHSRFVNVVQQLRLLKGIWTLDISEEYIINN